MKRFSNGCYMRTSSEILLLYIFIFDLSIQHGLIQVITHPYPCFLFIHKVNIPLKLASVELSRRLVEDLNGEISQTTYHLVADVVEVGDANLGSILEKLRLHHLDQLGNSVNAVDVGVHETKEPFS